MSKEKHLKRLYGHIDDAIGASKLPSERAHDQMERNFGLDGSSPEATEMIDSVAKTKTKGAINRSPSPTESETELSDFPKRPRLDTRRLLERKDLPYKTRSTTAAPSSHDDIFPMFPNFRPPYLDIDPNLLQDPKSIHAHQPPSQPLTTTHPPTNPPLKTPFAPPPPPLPRRPLLSLDQLTTDALQALKVLFLIDHATKGDAIHHAFLLSARVHPNSFGMKYLMDKCRVHRSRLQTTFFAKARALCKELTSRGEVVVLGEMGKGKGKGMGSQRERRMGYFAGKCTKKRLAGLYGHLASAVDVKGILAARGQGERALRDLMAQVFVHCMEDIWFCEMRAWRRDGLAKTERGDREEMYRRFRGLTDRVDGLPAAKVGPGYLDVPLRAGFPRYMLFGCAV